MSRGSFSIVAALYLASSFAAPTSGQTIVRQFVVPPASASQFRGLDYDPISDSIWAVDGWSTRVLRFTRTGMVSPTISLSAPFSPRGLAIDPRTGNVWIGGESGDVVEMRPDGTLTGVAFSTLPHVTMLGGLAFDPETRTLFASQPSLPLRIAEFSLSGTWIQDISLFGIGSWDPVGLAYHPLTRHFFLGELSAERVLEVDRTGSFVGAFALRPLGIRPHGLGIDTRSGALFVGDYAINFSTQGRVTEVAGIVAIPSGSVTSFGAACRDSSGTIPQLSLSDVPTSGSPLTIATTLGSTVSVPATFLLGLGQLNLALDFLGANGCILHTTSEWVLASVPNLGGRAGLTLVLPNDPAIAGRIGLAQALWIGDVGANSAGIVTSNGLRFVFQ